MSSIVLECPHHLRHLCHLSSHRQHFGNARRGLPRLRRGLLVLQKKRVQDLLILLLRMLRRRFILRENSFLLIPRNKFNRNRTRFQTRSRSQLDTEPLDSLWIYM